MTAGGLLRATAIVLFLFGMIAIAEVGGVAEVSGIPRRPTELFGLENVANIVHMYGGSDSNRDSAHEDERRQVTFTAHDGKTFRCHLPVPYTERENNAIGNVDDEAVDEAAP